MAMTPTQHLDHLETKSPASGSPLLVYVRYHPHVVALYKDVLAFDPADQLTES